jgi:hypothetical protein
MCDEVVIHRKDGTWLRCDDQGHLMAQMPRGLWFIDYTDCLAPGRTMFGIPDFENPLWHIEHGGYEPECCSALWISNARVKRTGITWTGSMKRASSIRSIPISGRNDMNDELLIHLWPGAAFHEDGYIVGSRKGMTLLMNYLHAALENGGPEKIEVMTGDGEGYYLHIILSEEEIRLALPYTESYAVEKRKNAIYPWDMV